MKLIFLTVMPSPYQRQLFNAMGTEKDLEVAVRYFTAGAHDREWRLPDLAAHEKVMPGRTLTQLGNSAHWNPSVLAEIGAARADLTVISDYSAPTAQLAMRALAARRRPFVFWGEVPGFAKRGVAGAFVRRRLQAPLGAAAAIAGIGSRAAEAYQTLFPKKPVFNIPYFCDLAPYRAARDAAPRRTGETVDILFSGQLIERKGVDILIQAFASLAKDTPRLRLLILGSGPEQARFEAMVPSELKSRVVFLGHREPDQLPAIFANADIFCLPSRHDGWGVVVNEALGAGLPVLASDAVGAAHELLSDGIDGFVTPAGDIASLYEAIERLTDDGLRAQMSEAARMTAENWSLSEGVARWRSAAQLVLNAQILS